MKRLVVLLVAAGALAFSGALATACSSTTPEAAPTRPVVPPVGTGSDAGQDADGAPVDPGCSGAAGCFKCEPVTNDNFLNACTNGQCTPFDNVARLPLYKAGQPLPPVP
jgi:hypothetical protein